MAQRIKLKNSQEIGKVPKLSDLELGEVAINTADGRVFIKKDNGVSSIIDLTAVQPDVQDTIDALDTDITERLALKADLENGFIKTSQLPSYVDDVLEFENYISFPVSGETGKIYVDKSTNKTYRWAGSAYIYITSGAVDTVDGQTGVVDLSNIYEAKNTNIQEHIADSAVHLTSVQKTSLTTGLDSTLHFHSSDRNRANHTGTQSSLTITNFQEEVQDVIGNNLVNTSSITLTYDDVLNKIKADANFGVISGTVAEGDHGHSINDLSDVIITTPTNGNILKYNGTEFVNSEFINDNIVSPVLVYSSEKTQSLHNIQAQAIANLGSAQGSISSESSPVFANMPIISTILPFAVTSASTNSAFFTFDAVANTITFLKDASYNFISTLHLKSLTNSPVTISFYLKNNLNGSTLVTQSDVFDLPNNTTNIASLNTLLTLGKNGIPSAPLTIRIEAISSSANYEFTSFSSILTSSASYDVTSEASGIIFSPAGNISSMNVQDALQELDTEKQAILVSGTNIKTVNSNSIIGPGNISVGTVTSVSALTIGTSGTNITSSVANGTTTPVITLNIPTASASNRGALSSTDWSAFNGKQASDTKLTSISGLSNSVTGLIKITNGVASFDSATYTSNTGTVTSVSLTVPTGLSVTDSPITSSGTLAVSFTAGYSIPTTASQTNWDTAYTDRNNWNGGTTGLDAATGRTSLGATTVGSNMFTLTNPSAITFPRFNADNTVSALTAAAFRTAIGAGTSSTVGTVTSVTAGNGMTQSGTSTVNPTLNIVSHAGTAGSIGTVNVGTDVIGVNLGTSSTTAAAGDHSHTLDNLSDVVITAPVTNQLLSFDGANWVNTTNAVDANTILGDALALSIALG